MLPIDKNGYWVIWLSFELCATKTWWRELVEPLETLTIPFRVEIWPSKNVAMVDADETLEKFDSNLVVLSVPSNWPGNANLYVPIPDAVVPIPITLDLTNTSLDWSFSKFKDNTPEFISDVNVPIKFEVTSSSVSA